MKQEAAWRGISRRAFLAAGAAAPTLVLAMKRALAAGAAAPTLALTVKRALATGEAPAQRDPLIDVNVHLSRWPLRRLPCDEPAVLVAKLRQHGVTQAWVGSFDALWHKDLAAVNTRLAMQCRRERGGLLVPFGSVNPKAPDWEEELRRCAEVHRMPGIRLYPAYHGYGLDDPDFARLLRLAAERRLIVQLAMGMEDPRAMHPRLRIEPVNPAPLADTIKEIHGLRLVLLNALGTLRGEPLHKLVATGEVYVELATLEGVGGVARLLEQVPLNRVLFGSHAPFFYFESAALKLQESALSPDQLRAIRFQNPQRLLA